MRPSGVAVEGRCGCKTGEGKEVPTSATPGKLDVHQGGRKIQSILQKEERKRGRKRLEKGTAKSNFLECATSVTGEHRFKGS